MQSAETWARMYAHVAAFLYHCVSTERKLFDESPLMHQPEWAWAEEVLSQTLGNGQRGHFLSKSPNADTSAKGV